MHDIGRTNEEIFGESYEYPGHDLGYETYEYAGDTGGLLTEMQEEELVYELLAVESEREFGDFLRGLIDKGASMLGNIFENTPSTPRMTPITAPASSGYPDNLPTPRMYPPAPSTLRSPVYTPPTPRYPVNTPPTLRSPVYTPPNPRSPGSAPPTLRSPVYTPPAQSAPWFQFSNDPKGKVLGQILQIIGKGAIKGAKSGAKHGNWRKVAAGAAKGAAAAGLPAVGSAIGGHYFGDRGSTWGQKLGSGLAGLLGLDSEALIPNEPGRAPSEAFIEGLKRFIRMALSASQMAAQAPSGAPALPVARNAVKAAAAAHIHPLKRMAAHGALRPKSGRRPAGQWVRQGRNIIIKNA